jgi:hypothetical protein
MKDFISDLKEIKARPRNQMEKGAVTALQFF